MEAVAVAALAAAVIVSRWVVLSAQPGEPDSALFPIGLWQWMHPGARASNAYDAQFSPGYYAACAWLARGLHLRFAAFLPLMNGISFAAAVATAPLSYGLGRLFLRPAPAFWASLLWLLSPALWWLGVEPHPEGPAIALLLAAMLLWRKRDRAGPAGRLAHAVAAWAMLTASLLARSDGIFCFGFFFPPGGRRRGWRSTAALLALATLGMELGRRMWLARQGADAPGAWRQIAGYLGGLSPARQALPFFTAAGAAALLIALAGILPGYRRAGAASRRHWLAIIGWWSLPGAGFWLGLRGNNVRHVVLYLLPVLWAGFAGWEGLLHRRLRRHAGAALAGMALAALLADAFLWPASSNLTLYPSGNVVASARLLHARLGILQATAARLVAPDAPGACYLGSYSSAYMRYFALRAAGLDAAGARGPRIASAGARMWIWPAGRAAPLEFHDVYSAAEFRAAARGCQRPYSFEYDSGGRRVRFLGGEALVRLRFIAAAAAASRP